LACGAEAYVEFVELETVVEFRRQNVIRAGLCVCGGAGCRSRVRV
jgi:hypothetical protein